MPKRLIDGEALWKSRKLKQVSVRYRTEYANLIPLAEANGVFDCDPERIWVEVYAYNRPDISIEDVVHFLDEFEKAGMLVRWSDQNKIWGYWIGIEKHLPSVSAIKRGDYGIKKGTPNPPEWVIQGNPVGSQCGIPENHTIGLGSGSGLGSGLGSGDEMRRRTFEAICHRYGLPPDPKGFDSWRELAGICEGLGDRVVESAFEEWASKHPNVSLPIAAFVKVGPKLAHKMVVVEENPQLDDFCDYVSDKSNMYIIFSKLQRSEVSELLDKYQYSDLVLAFQKFYSIIENDSYQLKFGAKDFVEKAPQIIRTIQKRREEEERAAKELAEIKSRVQAEAVKIEPETSEEDVMGELGI